MRLMKLPLAELRRDPDETITSSGAMIARVLLRKATLDQNHNAIVEVLDRIEGKAVKGAQNKTNNSHISDQLNISLDALDALATEGEK